MRRRGVAALVCAMGTMTLFLRPGRRCVGIIQKIQIASSSSRRSRKCGKRSVERSDLSTNARALFRRIIGADPDPQDLSATLGEQAPFSLQIGSALVWCDAVSPTHEVFHEDLSFDNPLLSSRGRDCLRSSPFGTGEAFSLGPTPSRSDQTSACRQTQRPAIAMNAG